MFGDTCLELNQFQLWCILLHCSLYQKALDGWSLKLNKESAETLGKIYGNEIAKKELKEIEKSIDDKSIDKKIPLSILLKPSLRFVMIVGLTLGIVQQITGINAIYFYATSIFKQTGIGTDAAFLSGVFLSLTTVLFTIIAIRIIDRLEEGHCLSLE